MMLAAIVVFALAIIGGLMVGTGHRDDYRPPKWLAFGHGTLAGTGIVLLVIAQTTVPEQMGTSGTISLVIFVAAAAGGLYLFTRRFKTDRTPQRIILLHAGLAITAFMFLIHAVTY